MTRLLSRAWKNEMDHGPVRRTRGDKPHTGSLVPTVSGGQGTVTETLERGNTVVVVKGVPAPVCDVCGNSLLAAEEVERLQRILKQADPDGVELESRRYQPI